MFFINYSALSWLFVDQKTKLNKGAAANWEEIERLPQFDSVIGFGRSVESVNRIQPYFLRVKLVPRLFSDHPAVSLD